METTLIISLMSSTTLVTSSMLVTVTFTSEWTSQYIITLSSLLCGRVASVESLHNIPLLLTSYMHYHPFRLVRSAEYKRLKHNNTAHLGPKSTFNRTDQFILLLLNLDFGEIDRIQYLLGKRKFSQLIVLSLYSRLALNFQCFVIWKSKTHRQLILQALGLKLRI